MNTPEARTGEDAEARAEALTALRVAAGLRLPAEGWAEARRAVEAVNAALRDRDTGALRDATGELELVEPARIRTGAAGGEEPGDADAAAGTAPAELRELLNRTVHALTAEPGAADATGAGPDAGGRD
ncbi:CATRA system-associated protein [Streptomyces sp. NPDC004134]|uniref:CATRA system-associated protein n=1 Tax=Streptomyces sp. NPDC004134 TaxID=3364691 RepID=UPI0036A798FD